MNQKISKGMFVKIHPKICEKKIPKVLSDKLNYTFINRIKDSPLEVIDLVYKCIPNSDFYELLINSNHREMIRLRNQFNIDSTLAYRNGNKYILMAEIVPKNGSPFHLPVSFLIESFDVPLSIY